MKLGPRLGDFSTRHYDLVTIAMIAVTLIVAALAALPSLMPDRFPYLNPVRVDTDPENMLAEDEPVRVFHNRMKKRLDLHDMVVVGVVNESDANGVFNPSSLRKIYELTEFARKLQWTADGERIGVVEKDMLAPSRVDAIEPSAPGEIRFEWLMNRPPETQAGAEEIRRKAMRVPFLRDTVVSDDGQALAIYLPITHKDISYEIAEKLRGKIAEFDGPEQFHITGLPVAEDQFGYEMFIQMAISAPAAMVVIFILMLVFFRKLVLVISPMILAMVSVILTMGLLVISGFPVHIMSSMIPIFIMPIAVLDSIHIISEFFDRYQQTQSRRETIRAVMGELFTPMLYTSLTSAAGFASLALTPIPPVQVFGVFVAIGVMTAWLLTMTFIPAFVMFIPPESLANFGAVHHPGEEEEPRTLLGRFLRWMGGTTYRRAKPIIAVAAVVLVIAGYGISRINVNDNPIKWFTPGHPIRVADEVLNRHFGGTYMAYLSLSATGEFEPVAEAGELAAAARQRADQAEPGSPQAAAFERFAELAEQTAESGMSRSAYFGALDEKVQDVRSGRPEDEPADTPAPGETGDGPPLPGGLGDDGESDGPPVPEGIGGDSGAEDRSVEMSAAESSAWSNVSQMLSGWRQRSEVFKDPEVLRYIHRLEQFMERIEPATPRGGHGEELVGKTNSLSDIVRTVRRDFLIPVEYKDDPAKLAEYAAVPDTRAGVGESLMQFQQSHRPYDLWHFVTPDYRTAAVWVQLRSGDNRDMSRVVREVDAFIADNPPPGELAHNWFGLTYINVVWQQKMVSGMLQAFLGSFLVVFLLMTLLFRSALWGLLSMIPLTVTIAAIYGAIGLVGKDYDMPVAVLSSLTLGLAVDFAIHFLARGRAMHERLGTWAKAARSVFGEPARAIARNIIVIAAGFTPLLLAPLMPYKTVGVLMATILLVSGVATLLLLPALIRVLERLLFPASRGVSVTCNCMTCIFAAAAFAGLVAVNLHQYLDAGVNVLVIVSVAIVAVLAGGCWLTSRRRACRTDNAPADEQTEKESPHA